MVPGRLTYVGHATVLIELDGVVLLTDPVLRERVTHVRRIVPAFSGPLRPDAILVSHAHRDHLDLPSLRRFSAPIYAPPAAAEVARRAGLDATAVEPGARVRIGGVDVEATEATHDGRRLPVGQPQSAVGFLVTAGARIYFAGDTDVFDGMRELSPGLDVALLPIWGWGARAGPGHMDPERAARAAALLAPRVAIPIHWGTYASPRVWWRDDPARFAREFERHAAAYAPDVAVTVLAPGQSYDLP
jgi:L-ascorbate metabolism protein UlaG (beta-lactamase superfamily)